MCSYLVEFIHKKGNDLSISLDANNEREAKKLALQQAKSWGYLDKPKQMIVKEEVTC